MPTLSRKHIKAILCCVCIFTLALTVRVILNFTVGYGYTPRPDSIFYQNIALHLLSEHCFCANAYVSTVDRAPLWPTVIAVIYSIGGQQNILVRLFLSVVDAGTCVLIYLYASNLFNARVGLVAGAIAIIYPGLFVYTSWMYPEALFTFLVFAFCYTLYCLLKKIKRAQDVRFHLWHCVLCGILLGAMSLQRPNGLMIAGLLVPWGIVLCWRKVVPWRRMFIYIATMLIITGAIIAPWTARNFLVSHAFVPVAVGDGSVLMGAYNDKTVTTPGFQGSWINPLASTPTVAKHYPAFCEPACEVNRENVYKKLADQWILQHKEQTLVLLELHFANLWQARIEEADLPTFKFSQRLSSQIVLREEDSITPIIIVLGWLGAIVYLKHWRMMLFPYLVIIATIAQCIYFYGIPRFRAPIEPLLVLFASGFVNAAVKYVIQLKKRRAEAIPTMALPQPDCTLSEL